MSRAPALIVPAAKKHTATVIFAHGLGDSGAGWMDLASNWRRRGKFEHVKFIFPNAPSMPITVNSGMAMPAWYDIFAFTDLNAAHDEPGILASRAYFASLVAAEADPSSSSSSSASASIPPSRIVLGGFSQGGSIALFTGMTGPHRLAGFFGLSSYLLMGGKIKDLVAAAAAEGEGAGGKDRKDVPVFMGHGDRDPLVKYDWGQRTAKAIEEMGWKVDFRTYRGLVHSASLEEMDDLEQFISKCLPPTEDEGPASSKA